jgi:hypothetical protein
MTAPLESATVPLIVPVAFWPNREEVQNRTSNSRPVRKDARELRIRVDLIATDMVILP